MASKLKGLDEKNFKEFINQEIALVSFGAPWCHACHQVTPILEELMNHFKGKVSFAKMDVVENPGVSSRYGVMSLPNILIFKKGKVAEQIIGVSTKKTIEEQIKKVIK